jgi:hypothetical protein
VKEPTKAHPYTYNGVTFRCYRVGISTSEWHSDDERARVGSPYYKMTYWASVDGAMIGRRYRSARTAMNAAVKEMQKAKAA